MTHYVTQLDQQLLLRLNQLHSPWGDYIVYWITTQPIWIPLYVSLLDVLQRTLQQRARTVVLLFAILATLCDQSTGLIKREVQRVRPCYHPDLQQLLHIVGVYHGRYGFPSAHAANTFGLAMFCWLSLRRRYPMSKLLLGWALGIAYARVYGGVHYPADVFIGAILGSGIGGVLYRYYARYLLQSYRMRANT